MDPIFLYGTLCYEPLRKIVLGAESGEPVPARLAGHTVRLVPEEGFATLVETPGAEVEGLLLTLAEPALRERLEYYQSAIAHEPRSVTVDTAEEPVAALAYVPQEDGGGTGGAFHLEEWVHRWGPLTCLAAEEILADMDTRPAAEVARRFGPMRARAQARLNARHAAPTTLRRKADPDDVRLRRRSLVYSRFFSVEEYDFTHRRFSGDHGEEMNRTAFISADAVTVLPYDPVRDRVLLIEQFRAGPFARGDDQPWMLEAIAGRIDGGETPEAAARREAVEEAGLTLGDLHLVAEYYPTPGAKSEFLYGYIATVDLPDEAAGEGGLSEEGEDIRSHVIPFDRAMALIDSGEINVGPLILLILHLARLRERLRG